MSDNLEDHESQSVSHKNNSGSSVSDKLFEGGVEFICQAITNADGVKLTKQARPVFTAIIRKVAEAHAAEIVQAHIKTGEDLCKQIIDLKAELADRDKVVETAATILGRYVGLVEGFPQNVVIRQSEAFLAAHGKKEEG